MADLWSGQTPLNENKEALQHLRVDLNVKVIKLNREGKWNEKVTDMPTLRLKEYIVAIKNK